MVSVEENGTIEILAVGPSGNSAPMIRFHTAESSAGSKTAPDYTKINAAWPAGGRIVGCPAGGRIEVHFAPDAADIIESEESALELPLQVNGVGKTFTLADFSGFTPAGAVDITYDVARQRRLLCYYDVPAGTLISGQPGSKIHAYIGDDTA